MDKSGRKTVITMRNAGFCMGALGIVFLAAAHFPSIHLSNQAKLSRGEGAGDCGAVALALICENDGNYQPLEEIRQLAHCTSQGTNMLNLKKAAESLGYTAIGARLGFDSLHDYVSKPNHFAILHLVPDHFIAVLGAGDKGYVRTAGLGKPSSNSDQDELRGLGWEWSALLLHSAAENKLLSMEPSFIDLRQVSVGSITEFSATIRNCSAERVVIAEIMSNCGCTDLQLEQPILECGASTRLKGRFRASRQSGVARKRVSLIISHPRQRVFEVELLATIVHILPVTPEALILKPNFLSGEPGIAEATIRNDSDHSVSLDVTPSQGSITLNLSKRALMPGETAILRLKVDPVILTVELQEITVSTSDIDENVIRLPVSIQPALDAEARPTSLRLGVTSRAEVEQKSPLKVALRVSKAQELLIEGIDTPPFLRVQDVPTKLEGVTHLLFYLKENWRGTSLSGIVELRMVHPQSGRRATFRIPVSGILRNDD